MLLKGRKIDEMAMYIFFRWVDNEGVNEGGMEIVHEVTMVRIDYGGIKRGMKNKCCRRK